MIALASDHAGFYMKNRIIKYLASKGIQTKDFGTYSEESCDYPVFAKKACRSVTEGECEMAILVCGTGIGMSMVANKIKGIRAAVCSDEFSTEFTRRHNDANVMCLGARVMSVEKALRLVSIFISNRFEGGKHARRVAMIENED